MLGLLESKIAGMRSQSMTFNNQGVEFALSVPDTNDVKTTFGSFVTTIVEQEQKIGTLNETIAVMDKQHAESQSKLIKWTTECITELKQQNAVLTQNLEDAMTKIANFSYNMQGFVDENDERVEISGNAVIQDVKTPSRPGTVSKPKETGSEVPTATEAPVSPQESSTQEPPPPDLPQQQQEAPKPPVNEQEILFFNTEQSSQPSQSNLEDPPKNSSSADVAAKIEEPPPAIESRNKGDSGHVTREPSARHRKASVTYQLAGENRCPKSARARWLWAINRVKNSLRIKLYKISVTRARVKKGQSILDRLERMETEMYRLSSELTKAKEAEQATAASFAEYKALQEAEKVERARALAEAKLEEAERLAMSSADEEMAAFLESERLSQFDGFDGMDGEEYVEVPAETNAEHVGQQLDLTDMGSFLDDDVPDSGKVDEASATSQRGGSKPASASMKSRSASMPASARVISSANSSKPPSRKQSAVPSGRSNNDALVAPMISNGIGATRPPSSTRLRVVNTSTLVAKLERMLEKCGSVRDAAGVLAGRVPHVVSESKKFQDKKHEAKGDSLQIFLRLDADCRSCKLEYETLETSLFFAEELFEPANDTVTQVAESIEKYRFDPDQAFEFERASELRDEVSALIAEAKELLSHSQDAFMLNGSVLSDNWTALCNILNKSTKIESVASDVNKLSNDVTEIWAKILDFESNGITAAPTETSNAAALPGNSEQLESLVKSMVDAYMAMQEQSEEDSFFSSSSDDEAEDEEGGSVEEGADGGATHGDGGKVEPALDKIDDDDFLAGETFTLDNEVPSYAREPTPKTSLDSSRTDTVPSNASSRPLSPRTAQSPIESSRVDEHIHHHHHHHHHHHLNKQGKTPGEEDEEEEMEDGQVSRRRKSSDVTPHQSGQASPRPHLAGISSIVASVHPATQKADHHTTEDAPRPTSAKHTAHSVASRPDQSTEVVPPAPHSQHSHHQGSHPTQRQGKPGLYRHRSKKGILKVGAGASTKSKTSAISKQVLAEDDQEDLDEFDEFEEDEQEGEEGEEGDATKEDDGAAAAASTAGEVMEKPRPAPSAIAKLGKAEKTLKGKGKKGRRGTLRDQLRKSVAHGDGHGPSRELQIIIRKIEEMYQDKLDTEKGIELLAGKANMFDLDHKVDVTVFSTVEKSLEAVSHELGDFKKMQKQEVEKIKKNMEKSLVSALSKILEKKEEDEKFAAMTTQTRCLTCGHVAPARSIAQPQPGAPPFIPALSSTSIPGIDVVRAGYRMPGGLLGSSSWSQLEPPTGTVSLAGVSGKPVGSQLLLEYNLLSNPELANSSGLSPLTLGPDGRLQSAAAAATGMLMSKSTGGSGVKVLKAIRHAQGREDAMQLRPIHRKGFPTRKTLHSDSILAVSVNDRFVDVQKDYQSLAIGKSFKRADLK